MAGVKRRSGGRNRLSAETHILNGTFRADRHGPRSAAPLMIGATALEIAVPPVPSDLVTGLRAPGRTFVTDVWAKYADWGPIALVLLRQAAEVTDALATYRSQLTKDGCLLKGLRGKRYPHPLLRVEGQARAMLRGLLAQLNLEQ